MAQSLHLAKGCTAAKRAEIPHVRILAVCLDAHFRFVAELRRRVLRCTAHFPCGTAPVFKSPSLTATMFFCWYVLSCAKAAFGAAGWNVVLAAYVFFAYRILVNRMAFLTFKEPTVPIGGWLNTALGTLA